MEFRIIRSQRRKKIALRIAADGVIEVLSPAYVPETFLLQLLEQEHDTITSLQKKAKPKPQLDLSENATFMLLGTAYPLHLTKRLRLFDHAFMIPDGTDEEKKLALTTLYRELAKTIIPRRVAFFSKICGITPEKININSASGRWGSCSGRKTLSFSWKLIQLPLDTVDYVVVHELSHLKEMNHSPSFWAVVKSIMPDYETRRKKLNALSRTLPHW